MNENLKSAAPGPARGAGESYAGEVLQPIAQPLDTVEDARIACRVRSQLRLMPDIIATATLVVLGPRTLQLDLTLNTRNITFNPGVAPQLCVTSKDGAVYLPNRSENVEGLPQLFQLPARVLFTFNVADPLRRVAFGFRLKFEEMRIQPRKVVAIAVINPGARTMGLSVLDGD